ncbi:MAG: hypothetical protein CSB06_00160 [Bacteroidia bacterium]|nr:MAG: hypothetical protein CSB06_00160 [Bacteroidia bacterium]
MKIRVSLFLLPALLLFSCKPAKEDKGTILDQIFEYKQKIKELEKQLSQINEAEDKKLPKVKILIAAKESVQHTFSVTGMIEAEEFAYVSPEMNGKIKTISVKEGAYVKKGQLLATLHSEIIQNSINELKTGMELAKIMSEKQKKLQEKKVGKEIDYLQAKNKYESLQAKLQTARAQLRLSKVQAPFSGIVDAIHGKVGEMASPARPLFECVNLNTMKITAQIPENYLPHIHEGDSVTMDFPTYPGLRKKTTIRRIGNIIHLGNRTFKIGLQIRNKDKKIKPNMISNLLICDYKGNDFVVPSIALKKDKNRTYLFVVNSENKVEKKYVETGIAIGSKSVITKGLEPGNKVVVEGQNLINAGTKVQILH